MINPKLTSIICLSLALASCEAPENLDRSVAKNEAKYMAGVTKHEIHTEYLNNYALDPRSKAMFLKNGSKMKNIFNNLAMHVKNWALKTFCRNKIFPVKS